MAVRGQSAGSIRTRFKKGHAGSPNAKKARATTQILAKLNELNRGDLLSPELQDKIAEWLVERAKNKENGDRILIYLGEDAKQARKRAAEEFTPPSLQDLPLRTLKDIREAYLVLLREDLNNNISMVRSAHLNALFRDALNTLDIDVTLDLAKEMEEMKKTLNEKT